MMRFAVLALGVASGCGRVGFAELPPDAIAVRGPTDFAARWLLDDDPTDGVADVLGTHDGACTACPTRINGIDDGAYRFAAAGTILVANAAALTPVTGFSVAFWTKPFGGPGCMVSLPLAGATQLNAWQICQDDPARIVGCVGGTPQDCLATENVVFGAWRHVVMTFDGSTQRLWTDGELVGVQPRTMTVDAEPLVLGGDRDDGSEILPFDGVLDDVRLWRRPLTTEEVAQVFAP